MNFHPWWPESERRKGRWICTASGINYYPLDPRPSEVRVHDIAWALAHNCRYNGHCNGFYSVAEHSVWVSRIVPPALALKGLFHDAAEAYCADVPTPLKHDLVGYKQIERMNSVAIALALGENTYEPPEVHEADRAMLLAEKPVLMPGTTWSAEYLTGTPARVKIQRWSPPLAFLQFMNRYHEITEQQQ